MDENTISNQVEAAINYKDYRPTAYIIDEIHLYINLFEEETLVSAQLQMRRNPHAQQDDSKLVLDGEELFLVGIELDDVPLDETRYTLTNKTLTLEDLPNHFTLTIRTKIFPQKNTALTDHLS